MAYNGYSSNKPNQMPITLTANYTETLAADTVSMLRELLDEAYDLEAMLTFIDEYNETQFVTYYEEYVRCGEAIGYEAVDALIGEMGCVSDIEDCDSRYQGCYQDEAEFAESLILEQGNIIPDCVVVDWQATWDQNLRYDFTACSDGSAYRSCHVFSDH